MACRFTLIAQMTGYIADTRKVCMFVGFTMYIGVTHALNWGSSY